MICAKCSAYFTSSDEVVASSCGHCYHKHCYETIQECSACFIQLRPRNLMKLELLFAEEETMLSVKEKLRSEGEKNQEIQLLRLRNKTLEKQINQLKQESVQAKKCIEELDMDLESERKSRRQFQSEKKSTGEGMDFNDDAEAVAISSDEEGTQFSVLAARRAFPSSSSLAQLRSCTNCKIGCSTRKCKCYGFGTGCSGLCGCQNCINPLGAKQ